MASRDFLVAFGGRRGEGAPPDDEAGGGSDDIELSLGLSLGGRFGTEAKRQRLVRSSSIASVCSISSMDGDRDDDPVPAAPLPLLRTSSLPTEVEEERWRRREMQSHRRLEARRKRVERRKSMVSSSSSGQAKSGDDAPDGGNGFQPRRSTGSQGSSSVNATEQGLAGSAIVHSTDASTLASDNNTKQSNVLPPPTSTGKLVNVRRIDHEEIELVAIATNSISKSLDKDSAQLNRLGGLLGYLLVYKEGLLSHRVDTEKKHENIEREREKS